MINILIKTEDLIMLISLNTEQLTELANIYHIAKILYNKNYDRLIYASKEFNKLYPAISTASAYKALDRMQSWKY